MWDYVGMSRNKEGLEKAQKMIAELREEFWKDVKIPGTVDGLNGELIKADRLADFIEMGGLMARDAYDRNESCGGHFREEYQTEEGEALRDDKGYTYVSAYEFQGDDKPPLLHKEPLEFEAVTPTQRSYK
jgi:succinate dehydrogenase / fumarate reductase flavoprotein subunit